MGKTIDIGGRIHNPEVGNVVTGANEILDDTKNKKQNVINSEVDAALEALDANKQDNLTFDQTPTESSTNPVTSGGVYAADLALQQAIEAILTLIPSAASALNQLADKSFVNSSIATASATFRGTYNLVSDLHLSVTASHQDIATALASAVPTADNNDYCFVQIPTSDTSSDIRVTERYKFNGSVWGYEYDLNNSGFTAAQWAAINSGITALLVTKLGALPTADELATALAGKQATLTFDNVPTAGSNNPVKSGGLYEAFAAIDAKMPAGASADNKLVAEDRLAAYVAAIIGALDASYNVTSSDGHVTVKVTQTDGAITSVEVLTSDIASASALTALGTRVSTNEVDIEALKALYQALQATPAKVIKPTDTWPVANPSQTVIYRVIDRVNTPPTYYEDYMWDGSGTTLADFILMARYNNAIDSEPYAQSENIPSSSAVSKRSEVVVLKGDGMTMVKSSPKWLKSGRIYRVELKKSWDFSTLDYGLFTIEYIKNGVENFIYLYQKAQVWAIPLRLVTDFIMPAEADYDEFRIAGRAPSGTNIEYTITDVTKEYEYGNAIGGAKYTASFGGANDAYSKATGIRLKAGQKYIIELKTTDWDISNVSVTDAGLFSAGYVDKDGNNQVIFIVYLKSGGVHELVQKKYMFVCPEYTDIYIGGRANSGVTVEFDIIEINETAGMDGLLDNNFFVGNGTYTGRTQLCSLIAGHKYRIYPQKTTWDTTGVSQGTGIFACDIVVNNVIVSTPFVVSLGETVKEYYDFVCPECDYVLISGRAAVGEKVFFTLRDITPAVYDGKPVLYRGEHFLNRSLNTKYGLGIKDTNGQGMAIYNGYIFQTVTTDYDVYKMGIDSIEVVSRNLSRNISGNENHGNSCQFAPNVAQGETFPYLYVAEFFNHTCHVQRVTLDAGMTTVQTITLDSGVQLNDEGSNVFMGDDGHIYSTYFYSSNIGGDGLLKVIKFRQVAVSEGDIVLGQADVVDSFQITPPDNILSAAVQGSKVYGGYLYFQFGGSLANMQGIYKINLATHQIVSMIDFYGFVTNEAEDFDIDFKNGVLYSSVIGNFYIKTEF